MCQITKKVRAINRSHLSTPNSVNNWIFNQLNLHAAVLVKKCATTSPTFPLMIVVFPISIPRNSFKVNRNGELTILIRQYFFLFIFYDTKIKNALLNFHLQHLFAVCSLNISFNTILFTCKYFNKQDQILLWI